MSRWRPIYRWFLLSLALVFFVSAAEAEVDKTVHNLAVQVNKHGGEGESVKSCTFCHTPHNANPIKALWNRELPANSYKLPTGLKPGQRVASAPAASEIAAGKQP